MTTTSTPLPSMPDLLALPGARVLITGGTRGIGAATARRFLEAGAEVVVASRTPVDEDLGRFVQADVATADGVDELARRAVETMGGVDVVVSNAGSQSYNDVPAVSWTSPQAVSRGWWGELVGGVDFMRGAVVQP